MIAIETLRAWVDADASEDALLQELERFAIARVEQHLGVPLGAPAERTDVVEGSGTATLYLPSAGATGTITTLHEVAYPGATPTPLAAGTDYERRGTRLVRLGGAIWYEGYQYHITAPMGYEDANVPPIVREVVLQLVSIKYSQKGAEDLQSETIGDYSYTRTYATGGGGLTAEDQILAKLPRRIRV